MESIAMKYIRNDTGSAFTIPLHVGPSLERHQITLAKGNNGVDPPVFGKLAGRQTATGKWKGGSASVYFNGDKLVELNGKPPAKDPCHIVELKPGVVMTMQSNQARQRIRQQSAQTGMLERQAAMLDLLARKEMDPETVRALAVAERAEAEARTVKAEADAAEARARLAAVESSAQANVEPGLDPTGHTVDDLRELAPAASFGELVEAIQIEKAREGGPRKGALDALTDALTKV